MVRRNCVVSLVKAHSPQGLDMSKMKASPSISLALRWAGAALSLLASPCLLGAAAPSAPTRPPTPAGWFHIIQIDARTYAISEPKYWQENVSYLLIGKQRALLFDTGPGIY